MNEDLKIIKKKYGEEMMKFCREQFHTLLEQEGLLSKLFLNNFNPDKSLYNDLDIYGETGTFKSYIYNLSIKFLSSKEENKEKNSIPNPQKLLSDAGYDLYECKTEADIQSFKKYYSSGEELCTFNKGRLDRCYVYFAVKKNVEQIKRENFKNPKRQDEYGTSVISIQFTNDTTHTLSIKNRYNHKVQNCDATFSNDLDNIIVGLTESFEEHYGMKQQNKSEFELSGYVKANDGKYYKYNYEINNKYYCNNIIIDNFEPKLLDKSKYIVLDYFVIDLQNKKIELYDKTVVDSFIETISTIKKITITNKEEKRKEILITDEDEITTKIVVDKNNRIVEYENNNIDKIKDNFLYYNECLTNINLFNTQAIGNNFLFLNKSLTYINLPNVQTIGDCFLDSKGCLTNINLPNVQAIGSDFLYYNECLTDINLPNVQTMGNNFLYSNKCLTDINLPNVQTIGDSFLNYNKCLKDINLSNARTIGKKFLSVNKCLTNINLSNVQAIGDYFLCCNKCLTNINLSNVQTIGDDFLYYNECLIDINLPNVQAIGDDFLYYNECLKDIKLSNIQTKKDDFGGVKI